MNDLNSVLIEGVVAIKPYRSRVEDGQEKVRFMIKTERHKDERGQHYEISKFSIEVCDRLGQTCKERLDIGRKVRIVGRMIETVESVIVVAEHVEFRPKKTEGEKT